jgi:hypothetical protein
VLPIAASDLRVFEKARDRGDASIDTTVLVIASRDADSANLSTALLLVDAHVSNVEQIVPCTASNCAAMFLFIGDTP